MPQRSKWHALPTEAINPLSLGIDKTPTAEIVDLMVAEDRKVVAAVQLMLELLVRLTVTGELS